MTDYTVTTKIGNNFKNWKNFKIRKKTIQCKKLEAIKILEVKHTS